jgi:hypothetical protein
VLFPPKPGSLADRYAAVEKFAGIPEPAKVAPYPGSVDDD